MSAAAFKRTFTPAPVRTAKVDSTVAENVIITQLKFLLEQAPMLDAAPIDFMRLSDMRAPYAYAHPITFAQMSQGRVPVTKGFTVVPRSPTRWVVTTLMPVGRILLTPNAMPFTGKIQAA
jgi:hypothetical protein